MTSLPDADKNMEDHFQQHSPRAGKIKSTDDGVLEQASHILHDGRKSVMCERNPEKSNVWSIPANIKHNVKISSFQR